MRTTSTTGAAWFIMGCIVGGGLLYLWPVETVQAVATDREERFAICTTETGPGLAESVFVLDFLTGRLVGATLNQQTNPPIFTNYYARNIAADFLIDATSKPKFVMIPGRSDAVASGRGVTMSTGVIYVGELNSGKVICYRFPHRISRTPLPPVPLEPVAFFSFREATVE
ncbi:MAG: hypothetical protein KatS3mg113_0047 [Planctomycetaceae bacterium]|nr:MAG: hypothetical protein KatS3mg113_0047 [Planctomycetaceae bacterium]